MNYRQYASADFEQLYALEELCFQPPLRFSRRMMRAFLQHPRSATWIAEEDNQMTGFAIVGWSERNGASRAYIQTIEVAPEVRRRGIARELLGHVESSAREAGAASIWLHVDASNAGAIRLYEARGYGSQGRKEGFYPLGKAALIYKKDLQPGADRS